jgi:hypothetical protein
MRSRAQKSGGVALIVLAVCPAAAFGVTDVFSGDSTAPITSSVSSADSIQFIFNTHGTGKIGSTNFSNAALTITAFGDMTSRYAEGPEVYFMSIYLAYIDIAGVGTFQITSPLRQAVNSATIRTGLARDFGLGTDLMYSPDNAAFATWDMRTSIGPMTDEGRISGWKTFQPINSTGGLIMMDDTRPTVTFQAIVGVPEPASVTLLAPTALLLCRRRRSVVTDTI